MYNRILKPLLFRLDAERAHNLVTALMSVTARTPAPAFFDALRAQDDPILATDVAGLCLSNPIGLAAGFDKRAVAIEPIAMLGFGHVEVGTVTPRPQPGNPRPRMFRLPEDRALINRLGFNSPGMVAVARNLRVRGSGIRGQRERARPLIPDPRTLVVGVNIGKNRDTPLERATVDYLAAFIALAPLADYVTVNISSPNTAGLRRLHERAALEELLGELAALNRRLARPRPLFLKVSPDETPAQLEQVAQVACTVGLAGLIATNTTVAREGLRSPLAREDGGLSGRPLAARARQACAQLYQLTEGRLPLIGAGGVSSGADAYAHIRAGASLVQLYTALVYEGPRLIAVIKRDLARLLRRNGFRSVAEAVGVDTHSSIA